MTSPNIFLKGLTRLGLLTGMFISEAKTQPNLSLNVYMFELKITVEEKCRVNSCLVRNNCV